MKYDLKTGMRDYLKGKVAYHRANISIYFEDAVGIGEHPDLMEAVEGELSKLAEYDEKLATLNKYFGE